MEINSFYHIYANNYITNFVLVISITGFVILLSSILPRIDARICGKYHINLQGGINREPYAKKFLLIRKCILFLLFAIYLLALLYVVFFSRDIQTEYQVRNSIENFRDFKLIDFLFPRTQFIEFYLNTALFVPMGYMLPYLFRRFRMRSLARPIVTCFLISLAIENIQLLTRRGNYDTGDILANVLGGILGTLLFLKHAYTLTNPNWKKDFRNYRRWRHRAKDGILFPYAKRLNVLRTILYATNEEETWNFYVEKLGFQLQRQLIPENSTETSFLFELGKTQIEVICLNRDEPLPKQSLTLCFENLDRIKDRLEAHGVSTGEYQLDPYTGRRCFRFDAPDQVSVTMLEA